MRYFTVLLIVLAVCLGGDFDALQSGYVDSLGVLDTAGYVNRLTKMYASEQQSYDVHLAASATDTVLEVLKMDACTENMQAILDEMNTFEQ